MRPAGWAVAHGGVPADGTALVATMYGRENYPVVIRRIRAIDVECERPEGESAFFSEEAGGSLYALQLEIHLDANASTAEGIPVPSKETEDSPEKSWDFPRQVSIAEADQFLVNVLTDYSVCSYFLEVEYRADGKQYKLRLPDNGKPFRAADVRLAKKGFITQDFENWGSSTIHTQ